MTQSETEEACSQMVIAGCRNLMLTHAEHLAHKGFRLDDIAIASAEAAFALAMSIKGNDPDAALAWMRKVLDVMEERLPIRATVQ